MKLFIACLATETNTFSPLPTGWGAFAELGLRRKGDRTADPAAVGLMIDAIHDTAARHGATVVEGLCACAQPLGPVVREVYERLRDELLSDLRQAMPVDAVQLLLHGAMVADGYEDCEGDVLMRVRELVGPRLPIGVTLDPHCHLTALMVSCANVLVAFREYPHTDTAARAAETCRLTLLAAQSRISPVIAVCDCPMVGLWPTAQSCVSAFVGQLTEAAARPGVLSVSFGHGFPWGDVPEAGAKCWAVTDGDARLAREIAAEFAAAAWELRQLGLTPADSIDETFTRLGQALRPLVIADRADNPGGGAPGDHTGLLKQVLARGEPDVVLGVYWDPHAVAICRDAGVGTRLTLRVGGKTGRSSGEPVDVDVTVEAVADTHSQNVFGRPGSFGPSAWVRTADRVDIVLSSLRQQVLEPGAFTRLGVPLESRRGIVVKSAHHFRTAFAPLASAIVAVDAGGALDHDFARLPYRRRSLEYWPRLAEPPRQETQ